MHLTLNIYLSITTKSSFECETQSRDPSLVLQAPLLVRPDPTQLGPSDSSMRGHRYVSLGLTGPSLVLDLLLLGFGGLEPT